MLLSFLLEFALPLLPGRLFLVLSLRLVLLPDLLLALLPVPVFLLPVEPRLLLFQLQPSLQQLGLLFFDLPEKLVPILVNPLLQEHQDLVLSLLIFSEAVQLPLLLALLLPDHPLDPSLQLPLVDHHLPTRL